MITIGRRGPWGCHILLYGMTREFTSCSVNPFVAWLWLRVLFRYYTYPNEPRVDYPEGFQGNSIPVYGPNVVQIIEDRVEGKIWTRRSTSTDTADSPSNLRSMLPIMPQAAGLSWWHWIMFGQHFGVYLILDVVRAWCFYIYLLSVGLRELEWGSYFLEILVEGCIIMEQCFNDNYLY